MMKCNHNKMETSKLSIECFRSRKLTKLFEKQACNITSHKTFQHTTCLHLHRLTLCFTVFFHNIWCFAIIEIYSFLSTQSSDGKVRLYRLSSAIRRLSQESRWQPTSNRDPNHHKESYPLSLIPTLRNRQRRQQQQLIISIKPRKCS